MLLTRKITCWLIAFFSVHCCYAQTTQFSLATDLIAQKNIREGQKYWAIGQTITGQFNFSKKNAAYVWGCFFSKGKFDNDITATAKSASTIPQRIDYINQAELKMKEISLGWKHYFIGTCDAEDKWNLYCTLGLGLIFGNVLNSQSIAVDSSLYNNPVLPGEANFKRLTYDLGLGIEKPLGGDTFVYLEAKSFVPSTDYPSDHLLVNHNAPLTLNLCLGIRILFD